MDKKTRNKVLIVTGSILAFGVIGFYTYSWMRTLGKKKIEDEGFDIYIKED